MLWAGITVVDARSRWARTKRKPGWTGQYVMEDTFAIAKTLAEGKETGHIDLFKLMLTRALDMCSKQCAEYVWVWYYSQFCRCQESLYCSRH